MCAVGRNGDGTGVEASPDAIAPAGNEAVDGISKESGDGTQGDRDGGPGKGQNAKGGKDGARADQDLGTRRERLANDKDRAGSTGRIWGYRVSREKCSESRIARGGEAQAVIAIAAKEPLDGGVAKTAVAVVDNEEAIAELARWIGGAAEQIGDGLGLGGHLIRRMRAGVGRMQGLPPGRR